MMDWLLILTLFVGQASQDEPAGLMANQYLCVLAGASMTAVMAKVNPGVRIAWRCEKREAV